MAKEGLDRYCRVMIQYVRGEKGDFLKYYESEEIDYEIFYIDKHLIQLEINEDIEDILSCLNDKDKELFIKYYIEGYKLSEIAKKDKTNVSNLHSRLSRGRKRIKERFKVQGGINYEK